MSCEDCESLRQTIRYLRLENEKLSDENGKLYEQNSTLDVKVRTELNPRIEKERKGYDNYVKDGGSDPCFRFGMAGRCGEECTDYDTKPECTET